MTTPNHRAALIVGVGDGLSASLARLFAAEGHMRVGLASRNVEKLAPLVDSLGRDKAFAIACDAAVAADVDSLFDRFEATCGMPPDVVVYNASGRLRGPLADLDRDAVARALTVSAYGGFLIGQAAVIRMMRTGFGAILFTGATASVKGYPHSAPFAMGKFALRGLAQSMARELAPKGIHVAHFIIDGVIRNPGRTEPPDAPDSMLDPDAIARTYLYVLRQDRSAWTWEIELRPWVENF